MYKNLITQRDLNYIETFEEKIGMTVIFTDTFQRNSNIVHMTGHFLDNFWKSVNITVIPMFSSKVSTQFKSQYVIKFLYNILSKKSHCRHPLYMPLIFRKKFDILNHGWFNWPMSGIRFVLLWKVAV